MCECCESSVYHFLSRHRTGRFRYVSRYSREIHLHQTESLESIFVEFADCSQNFSMIETYGHLRSGQEYEKYLTEHLTTFEYAMFTIYAWIYFYLKVVE